MSSDRLAGPVRDDHTIVGRALADSAPIVRFRANAARSAAPEFIDIIVAGLRLAGLPEGQPE